MGVGITCRFDDENRNAKRTKSNTINSREMGSKAYRMRCPPRYLKYNALNPVPNARFICISSFVHGSSPLSGGFATHLPYLGLRCDSVEGVSEGKHTQGLA